MNSTYTIRLTAIKDTYVASNDTQRYLNDLSRLSIDTLAMLRRCERIGEVCDELVELLAHIDKLQEEANGTH